MKWTTPAENMLYRQLVSNHWSVRLRLEQERIGFGFLHSALQQLTEPLPAL